MKAVWEAKRSKAGLCVTRLTLPVLSLSIPLFQRLHYFNVAETTFLEAFWLFRELKASRPLNAVLHTVPLRHNS